MIYQLAFDTFIGARSENQDSILNIKIAEDVFLVGIADGMGGMAGGKLASSMTVEAITDYIHSLSPEQFEGENLKNILSSCHDIASFCIQKAIENKPELKGMGTTLSLLLICGDMYVWSNIGDSRIYLLENNQIKLLTIDHTLIQQLSALERSSMEDSVSLKYDHVLTKCLDGSGELPDIFPVDTDYRHFDQEVQFMLCSDGLILDKSDSDQTKLMNLMSSTHSVQNAVSNLISYAYSEGSKDNISVGVVRISDRKSNQSYKQVEDNKKLYNIYNWGIYLLLGLIVVVSGGIFISSLELDFDKLTGNSTEYIDSAKSAQLGWQPLKVSDFNYPIEDNQDINWQPYRGKEKIRYYHVVLLSGDQVLTEKYFKSNHNFISTAGLQLIKGETYTLAVDAISTQDKRIVGNSVEFIYDNQN